jgi:DNA-binding transcriptional regulator YiaG
LAFSRQAAAVALGTAEETVRNWENGKNPLPANYPKIIAFLGHDPWPAPVTLPQAIRAARWRRGLAIEDAAAIFGVDPSTLWWWENGRKPHRLADRARLETFVARQSDADPKPSAEAANEKVSGNTRDVGAMIKARRAELGLSQAAAGNVLGVNSWTVLNWENGYNAPTDRLFPTLIRFLECEPCGFRRCRHPIPN